MSSLRCVLFGMLTKRSHFMKRIKCKINEPFAYIHHSRFCLNGQTIEIKMPSLSPTMTEGTIVKWLKKEGDTISPGDVLCEIQTDKAVVGLEVEEEGTLTKILIPEDTKNIQLGEVIAIIMEGDVDISKEKPPRKSPESPPTAKETISTPQPKEKITDSLRLCGPSVKKLLQEYGIKYSEVSGNGPHNNLLKGDVLNYIRDKNLKQIQDVSTKPILPSVPQSKLTGHKLPHIDIPISSSRKSIAQQLIQSKYTMPHAYMNVDCKIDKIFEYKKQFKSDGIVVSLDDFVIKSAATALHKVPKMNIINQNGQVKQLESINIAMSVFKDNGYITPVVRNADKLTLDAIYEVVNSTLNMAKEPKLLHEGIEIGSFRISNLGSFGVSEFTAIIYPPEVATLTVGTVRYIMEEQRFVQRMQVTLSFDNAVVSEIEASSFLSYFKQCLEDPLNITCLS